MSAYYNEFEPYAAQWLHNLIVAGLIAPGDVDTRSIVDVEPSDLDGYTQCHFFAGIGGWSIAARLAGWPDSRELWTGSAPCQPFSVAGKGKAQGDDRHLWPHYFRLIRAQRPSVCMGEQVAAAIGKDWLDGVFADLEGIGYACGAAVVPACGVNAPHRRDRLWFVADADGSAGGQIGQDTDRRDHRSGTDARAGLVRGGDRGACSGTMVLADDERSQGHSWHGASAAGRAESSGPIAETGSGSAVADARSERRREVSRSTHGNEGAHGAQYDHFSAGDVEDALADSNESGTSEERQQRSRELSRSGSDPWASHDWIIGHDGKARRIKPGVRLLAHGIPNRVGRLRAYGNAIVPQVAAEMIGAYMDCRP